MENMITSKCHEEEEEEEEGISRRRNIKKYQEEEGISRNIKKKKDTGCGWQMARIVARIDRKGVGDANGAGGDHVASPGGHVERQVLFSSPPFPLTVFLRWPPFPSSLSNSGPKKARNQLAWAYAAAQHL